MSKYPTATAVLSATSSSAEFFDPTAWLKAALTELLRECMENALELKVPIVVDFGVGANWREAH